MQPLFRSPWFSLDRDDATAVVHYRRSAVPFATAEELLRAFSEMELAVAKLDGHHWRLLLDSRDAPMRNDPAFEEAMRSCRRRFVARFARVAVLVKTAIGKLQISRYAREDGRRPRTFEDEAMALAYLTRRTTSRPPRPSEPNR
jgi:hypothetical protein